MYKLQIFFLVKYQTIKTYNLDHFLILNFFHFYLNVILNYYLQQLFNRLVYFLLQNDPKI